MDSQPLSQLHWNGCGRRYALRYWACLGSNPDKQTLETDSGESVSVVVGDLEGWTSYCIQVAACNRLGCSEFGQQESARTMESGNVSFSYYRITFLVICLNFRFLRHWGHPYSTYALRRKGAGSRRFCVCVCVYGVLTGGGG